MKKYAGFNRRLGGYLIDCLILIVVVSLIRDNGSWINILIGFVYSVWMIGKYGGTIGMRLMGIRAVKENGKPLTYSDAAVREIASYLSFIAILLGYFWMLWDKKRQTWHDKIAHSVVIIEKR